MTPFSPDYATARARFRDAARARGLPLSAEPVPGSGPDGGDLSTDVARFGPAGAARLLILTSGIHGNEGLCGSAVQLDLLETLDRLTDAHNGLPAESAILLVHAVNPWGMAHRRRQNEANIDLNRNFRDWNQPVPARPEYAAFHDRLCPASVDPDSEAQFVAWARGLVAERGIAWVQARFTEGQWSHPRGLYYGGDAPAFENDLLRRILARELEGAREAVHIDIHTGMGAWGDHILLAGASAGTAQGDWLATTFPPQRLVLLHSASEPHGGRWPRYEGKMTTAIAAEHPAVALHGLTIEFGTRDGETVFMAERREHWAWGAHGAGSPEQIREAAPLQEHMVPSDPLWRERVLDGARATVTDAWRALVGEGKER
jgi:hypothetical protein